MLVDAPVYDPKALISRQPGDEPADRWRRRRPSFDRNLYCKVPLATIGR